MAEPSDLILPMLREMRAEGTAFREEMRSDMAELKKRLETVRQAAFGESVLGRYAAAEVEERMEAFEKRLAALEGKH
jgi:polyhydroxyalkanoate synthesis regulator phasin